MAEYNAGERKDVKLAEKAARLAERERQEVITGLMSTIGGRAYVLERLTRCHVFASSFGNDPYATAFAEGERNIGLRDLNDIMAACPDLYVTMMREHQEKELTADVRRDRNDRNAIAEFAGSEDTGREPEES